ncbi:hypothetical protein VIGAN_04188700 [Vigna angularis var. angularis]|uniref:Uncharacterized protein n=1 Tax=Vigna angularis var. angularis TaxID=157739 RepID=A0A0S3RVA3_PHAAN|nr:hypothetical protein VIGAN_04188700 [Vigna angularis var. angularis]
MFNATTTILRRSSNPGAVIIPPLLVDTSGDITRDEDSENGTYSIIDNANNPRHESDNLVECLTPKGDLFEIHNLSPIKYDSIIEAFHLDLEAVVCPNVSPSLHFFLRRFHLREALHGLVEAPRCEYELFHALDLLLDFAGSELELAGV